MEKQTLYSLFYFKYPTSFIYFLFLGKDETMMSCQALKKSDRINRDGN